MLNPSLNRPPDNINHIHLMGICGTGVGALAGMLQSRGYTITGSDQNVYPPMSDFLAGLGIAVMSGYSAENLNPKPDLVIVGNVITRQNPEAIALAELSIPYLSMPQALGHFFLNGKTSLVVCGTHGKTTTSSLLATLLHYADCDPGCMIGGIVQEFAQNFRVGQGKHFVVEGDEYDTAFFDKGPKFIHYQPKIAIVTSIEFDHADIYADLDAIKKSFAKLMAIMPDDGLLVANFDDPVVREISQLAKCRVSGYGQIPEADWQLQNLAVRPGTTEFSVVKNNKPYGTFHTPMPGLHNAMNSLAVLAVLDQLGTRAEDSAKFLQKFPGVRRRQEVRAVVNDRTVIDDFAHHPTAVRETLAALRSAYPGQRLIAVFEPRTNSSRRRVFQDTYAEVFDDADIIIIKEPEPLSNIDLSSRFSAQELIEKLILRKKQAFYFPNTDEILEYLPNFSQKNDVIAIMSNGGFDNIHIRLIRLLERLPRDQD